MTGPINNSGWSIVFRRTWNGFAIDPGCPIPDCTWGSSIIQVVPPAIPRHQDDVLGLVMGLVEHLRDDHHAAYPWEDHAGQDQRVSIQLEPERVDRLIEVLHHFHSLRARYTEGADALALAEDIANMAARQHG